MQTALITGASSGIGAACAKALADKGFRVCLTARRQQRLEELADQINAKHGPDRAIYFPADVTDKNARENTLKYALEKCSAIDVLVNNAGFALAGTIEELDLDEVRKQFEINTFTPMAWMQMVGPDMRKRSAGRIINISSISGKVSTPGLGVYSASKFAIEAISDAARVEYKPWGVHVILIEPGSIVTEIWDNSLSRAKAQNDQWQDSPFRDIYEVQLKHAEKLAKGQGPSVDSVTRAICHAATSSRPKARYRMPLEATIFNIFSHFPTGLRDRMMTWAFKINNKR